MGEQAKPSEILLENKSILANYMDGLNRLVMAVGSETTMAYRSVFKLDHHPVFKEFAIYPYRDYPCFELIEQKDWMTPIRSASSIPAKARMISLITAFEVDVNEGVVKLTVLDRVKDQASTHTMDVEEQFNFSPLNEPLPESIKVLFATIGEAMAKTLPHQYDPEKSG